MKALHLNLTATCPNNKATSNCWQLKQPDHVQKFQEAVLDCSVTRNGVDAPYQNDVTGTIEDY